MEKNEFVEALEKLAANEDVLEVSREINELRRTFEDYTLEATRQFQVAELKAKEKNESFEEEDWITPLKEQFYSIYSAYNVTRKKVVATKKQSEEENLKQKRILIDHLKEVVKNEKNIGAAFAKQKEINEKWKVIGEIPRKVRYEIDHQYSLLLDEFFHNIHIYKEIKEYDFQKNFDTKKSLIEELKKLLNQENTKHIEKELNSIQNQWNDVGPTRQELWEEIKEEYWQAIHAIHAKINAFYKDRREERVKIITKKEAFIVDLQKIVSSERTTVKEWNKQIKEVIALQNVWKKVGFGARKEEDRIWKEFRALCDQFFEEKTTFFDAAKEEFDEVASAKEKLIKKANELKNSTDWKTTKEALIKLQKEWKKLGNAGRKNEQRLWKKFRSACDYFFEAMEKNFQDKKEEYQQNLSKKEQLVKELIAFNQKENKEKTLEQLNKYAKQYASIGDVPKKESAKISSSFKKVLFEKYDSLQLDDKEKKELFFAIQLDIIKGSDNSQFLFKEERKKIKKQINQVKEQILQYENNLGFFKYSKGDNPLKAQVEENIENERKKIDILKLKLKKIPNE